MQERIELLWMVNLMNWRILNIWYIQVFGHNYHHLHNPVVEHKT